MLISMQFKIFIDFSINLLFFNRFMLKLAKSQSNKLNYFVKHCGKNILETDDKILVILYCVCSINASKRFHRSPTKLILSIIHCDKLICLKVIAS